MNTLYHADGRWMEDGKIDVDVDLHGLWNGSMIFDGARAMRGRVPDLLRHCERLVRWAPDLFLQSPFTAREIAQLALEGVERFPKGTDLYIRPILFGKGTALFPPAATGFMLQIEPRPLMSDNVAATTKTTMTRPAPGTVPVNYKAGWLYTHCLREIHVARQRGYNEAVMRDPGGRVVEFAGSNLFLVRDGRVHTPSPNGSFLPGVTRRRIIELLNKAGLEVVEKDMALDELFLADEVFSTGNMGKIRAVTRIDEHTLERGPVCDLAWSEYLEFSEKYDINLEEDEA